MISRACLALTLAAAACSAESGTGPGKPVLDQPFEVRVGETALLSEEGLAILLEGVRNDSRCPIDVVCVWEGDAELMLQVQTTPEDREEVSLHSSGRLGRSADYRVYRIELCELRPPTKSRVRPDPKAYVATLVVSRNDR
jgi:hypothetical protein